MRRRIRRIGEKVVPLTDTYPYGVAFVGRYEPSRTGTRKRIAATSFFVSIPIYGDAYLGEHAYLVTAAHVVEGRETFVRVPLVDGGVRDLDVPDWISHGKHDVAVAPIEITEDMYAPRTAIDQFIDDPHWMADDVMHPLELGDIVYFIGLLGRIPEMVERNVPIVRAGTLGAMWQEQVPVRRSPVDELKYITAHLIDCRSFGGFSGSPCYIQQSRAGIVEGDDGRPGVTTKFATALLGLIGGHFDDWTSTRMRNVVTDDAADDDASDNSFYAVSDDVKAPVSTGVGYVIPAEYIRATLMRQELVDMRDEEEQAIRDEVRAQLEDDAGTMDALDSPAEELEFDRFKDLARKLVNTPKSEIDEKRKDES
jgi:hypothetical protein